MMPPMYYYDDLCMIVSIELQVKNRACNEKISQNCEGKGKEDDRLDSMNCVEVPL